MGKKFGCEPVWGSRGDGFPFRRLAIIVPNDSMVLVCGLGGNPPRRSSNFHEDGFPRNQRWIGRFCGRRNSRADNSRLPRLFAFFRRMESKRHDAGRHVFSGDRNLRWRRDDSIFRPVSKRRSAVRGADDISRRRRDNGGRRNSFFKRASVSIKAPRNRPVAGRTFSPEGLTNLEFAVNECAGSLSLIATPATHDC